MADASSAVRVAGDRKDAQCKVPSFSDRRLWALALGSIGVVYGDIGTSPLYAFKEAVSASKTAGLALPEAVLGVLSLILWLLLLIVTLKYVFVLLRADNTGEGGTFALMSLGRSVAKRSAPLISILGIVGASLFFGDAVITPAISVLSAVEGLKLVAPGFEPFVLPIAVGILIALFAAQSYGTEIMARFFGPIMLIWFVVLAAGGIVHIVKQPQVLSAFNPLLGLNFIIGHGMIGLTILGLVFLAVTGAEALYADLGHFGRMPIQTAWVALVLPSLTLNYLGQGALLLTDPTAIENPFYRLYPSWALVPMVGLATLATVIASQAVITGAFSLARQAVQLGMLPRLVIRHTSETMEGQIYLPRVNTALLIGVLFVTIQFRSSEHLAAAYGVSVTATMVVASAMMMFVIWKSWGWKPWQAMALMLPILCIEEFFFVANMLKVFDGGWFPLALAGVLVVLMMTWARGSALVTKEAKKTAVALDWLARKLEASPPFRASGTAVFLAADPSSAPTALMHNLKHNKALHERNIVLSMKTTDQPHVSNNERLVIERLSEHFIVVQVSFGFMETPNVPQALSLCRKSDLNIDPSATSFFVSRRTLKPTSKSILPLWQEKLFIAMSHTADDASAYFQIPADRVVEIGTQVKI